MVSPTYWTIALRLSLALGVLHARAANTEGGPFGSGSAEIAAPWFSLRPPVLLDGRSLALKFASPLICGSRELRFAWTCEGIYPEAFKSFYSEGGRPFFDPWKWSTTYFFEMKLAGNPVNVESFAARSR